jgi:hypothetical protein
MASPNWADAVYDGGLNFFTAGTATRAIVCSTEPTNYTQAATTYKLAEYTLVGGDFTKSAGTVSGRKVVLGAKTGAVATGTGAGNFVAFTNGTDTLYGVIDGDGDAITTGQTVNIAATTVLEIRASVDG